MQSVFIIPQYPPPSPKFQEKSRWQVAHRRDIISKTILRLLARRWRGMWLTLVKVLTSFLLCSSSSRGIVSKLDSHRVFFSGLAKLTVFVDIYLYIYFAVFRFGSY